MNARYRLLARMETDAYKEPVMSKAKNCIEEKCNEIFGEYKHSITFIDHPDVKVKASGRRYTIESSHILVMLDALQIKKDTLNGKVNELIDFIREKTDRLEIEFDVVM